MYGKKGIEKNVPVRKVDKMAWIGKKRYERLDEISKEKLPSEFENSSNSTWHTATLTTQHIHVVTRDYISITLISITKDYDDCY